MLIRRYAENSAIQLIALKAAFFVINFGVAETPKEIKDQGSLGLSVNHCN